MYGSQSLLPVLHVADGEGFFNHQGNASQDRSGAEQRNATIKKGAAAEGGNIKPKQASTARFDVYHGVNVPFGGVCCSGLQLNHMQELCIDTDCQLFLFDRA